MPWNSALFQPGQTRSAVSFMTSSSANSTFGSAPVLPARSRNVAGSFQPAQIKLSRLFRARQPAADEYSIFVRRGVVWGGGGLWEELCTCCAFTRLLARLTPTT